MYTSTHIQICSKCPACINIYCIYCIQQATSQLVNYLTLKYVNTIREFGCKRLKHHKWTAVFDSGWGTMHVIPHFSLPAVPLISLKKIQSKHRKKTKTLCSPSLSSWCHFHRSDLCFGRARVRLDCGGVGLGLRHYCHSAACGVDCCR